MIVFKKAIPRRTVLRGMGASLALPLLDAMVPSFTALAKTAANPTKRLGVVYVPNGIIGILGVPEGKIVPDEKWNQWTPKTSEPGFQLSPTLEPLEPHRSHVVVLTGLDNRASTPRPGDAIGSHSRPAAAFLSGMYAKRTTGSRLDLGISMDQIAANTVGRETQLPSLELALEGTDTVNGVSTCDTGYSCAYLNISWRNESTPMPRETNPRMVFERLFGDVTSTDSGARLARAKEQRSILDMVMGKVARLQAGLAPYDQRKLTEYLDSVRDIERRIQIAEGQADRELPEMESPAGIPVSWEEHATLMYDLLLLAYQTDITRVFTFMIGREQSGTTYPWIGVPDPHHPITHHQRDPVKMEKVAKINRYHVQLFSDFLGKLKATPDGENSLLDNTMLLYGSPLREGNGHSFDNLPLLVAGGGAGEIRGDRHLVYPAGETPMTNLQLTLLHKLGVNVDHFGDSTGELKELSSL